jgi:hypothetical protein
MTTLMQTITFPKTSFRTAIRGYIRKDGEGLNACLWRELIQNARDAGATRVDASLDRVGNQVVLRFRDNGKGMDWDTLQRGMLTYAGSVKQDGDAGGFGMAKNVICFASDDTVIRTHNQAVRIEGIQYECLDVTESIHGTEVVIRCPQDERPDLRLEPTAEGLRFLLARCDLRGMSVYLNGERIPDCRHETNEENVVKTFDSFGGKAYYWKRRRPFWGLDGERKVAVLTHRGIWVCDIPLPCEVKGAVLIDADADPKKMLNDTRTALSSYGQRCELDGWIGRLNQGAHSTLKSKKFVKRFDGQLFVAEICRKIEEIARQFRATCQDLATSGQGEQLLRAISEQLPAGKDRLDSPALDSATLAERLTGINADDKEQAIRQLVWRPAMMVVNERDQCVPPAYLPETMTPTARKLLYIWAEMVRQFLIWRKEFRPFGVGFIFSEDTAAQFREESDGTIWFLVNPVDDQGRLSFALGSEEDKNSLVTSAAHEVAHCKCPAATIHGDTFVTEFGENVRIALSNHSILGRIWKTAGR